MIIQPSFSQFFQCSSYQLGSAYELSSRVKKKQNVSLLDINHNVMLITFSLNRPVRSLGVAPILLSFIFAHIL